MKFDLWNAFAALILALLLHLVFRLTVDHYNATKIMIEVTKPEEN